MKKITACKWALAVNPFVLYFVFGPDRIFLEKEQRILKLIDSSKKSRVPSYTPPQNRGVSWNLFVAFGCEKISPKRITD